MKAQDNLNAWRILYLLAEKGSLKAASIELDLDLSRCFRLVEKLEEEFGIDLLNHRTKPVSLSAEAKAILPFVKKYLSAFKALEKEAYAAASKEIHISLGVPINSPRETFFEFLKEYRKIDPNLIVDVLADCDHVDVLRRKVDAAYLPYRPPEEGLMIWTINEKLPNVPWASPSYIAKFGNPKAPEELADHSVILREGRNYPVTKYLTKDGEKKPLLYKNIAFRGDVLSSKVALLNGEGIAIDLSLSSCLQDYKAGKIKPVLNGWHRLPWDVTLITSRENLSHRRLCKFLQWFAEQDRIASQERVNAVREILEATQRSS